MPQKKVADIFKARHFWTYSKEQEENMTKQNAKNVSATLSDLTRNDLHRILLFIHAKFFYRVRKIPEALLPEDLLQEVLADLLEGKVDLPAKEMSLAYLLYRKVKDKVRKYEKRRRKYRFEEITEIAVVEDAYGETAEADNIPELSYTVINQLIKKDEPELKREIIAVVQDDSLLVSMVEYWFEYSDAPSKLRAATMAEALGVTVPDIYNGNKRLKRHLRNSNVVSIKDYERQKKGER